MTISDPVGMPGSAWLQPDWCAPASVCAATTTRGGPGRSQPPFDRCNLGLRSGDEPAVVQANREAVIAALELRSSPCWLQQVHGAEVVRVDAATPAGEPVADAAVTREREQPLAILTADCLPVLFRDDAGDVVAAAHAGWRGLALGVLENTIAAMDVPAPRIAAWLGPCIGAPSYEVGDEVREAFLIRDPRHAACFSPTRQGHWLCDLAGLARRTLRAAGVDRIYGGGFDTFTDARFYSYRRDGVRSGRFASLIWLDDA